MNRNIYHISLSLIRLITKRYCSFLFILLLGVSLTLPAQDVSPSSKIKELHARVNGFLNSGYPDSLQYYAQRGKRFAKSVNDQKELAYFNYILGASIQTENPEKGVQYLDTALNISKAIDYTAGEMLVYDARSNMLRKSGYYDSALVYSEMSRGILLKMPDSKRKNMALCASFSTAGLIYLRKGDYPNALDYLNQAHALALHQGFTSRLYYYKENIAGINMQLGRYDEAQTYFGEVLSYATETKNNSLKATSLLALGQIATRQKRYVESLPYYHKALRLSAHNRDIQRFDIIFEIASLHGQLGNSDSVRYYADAARALAPDENHKFKSDLLLLSAKNYLKLGKYAQALTEALKGLSLVSVEQSLEKRSEVLKLISDIYFASNQPTKGHGYYLQYDHIQDSLFSLQNLNKVSELQLVFETALKNEEIENLAKLSRSQEREIARKNQLILLSALVVFLLLLLIYFVYRQRVIKAKSNELVARQKLANAQMNPHFLFNSLSAIQELVLENKDVLKTSDFLAKFSKLTRQMLNYTDSESIYLSQELEFLTNYLDLQKLRFGDKFSYQIFGLDGLDTDDFFVPPLIIQPFAENALEHGFYQSDRSNKLIIRVVKNQNGVSIEIEDNGIGIDSTLNLKNQQHESKAISLTQGRLKFWQRKTGKLAGLDILDLSKLDPATRGTRITLNLPNI